MTSSFRRLVESFCLSENLYLGRHLVVVEVVGKMFKVVYRHIYKPNSVYHGVLFLVKTLLW
jgi:hypothetical protein